MNASAIARTGQLARSLDMSLRELLVTAMHLGRIRDGVMTPTERLHNSMAQVLAARRESNAVANLLQTPITSFAKDDIDFALATLWSSPDRGRG